MGNPIIDLIIRIKNGYMSRRETIDTPYSKMREEVVKKLKQLKFIEDYTVEGQDVSKKMVIELAYENDMPVLTDVKIFSKPGRRHYVSYRDLKPVLNNLGYSILSTPQGIMTNHEARKNKLGGELLFYLW
jgi:small subunit ribosomal protein S8